MYNRTSMRDVMVQHVQHGSCVGTAAEEIWCVREHAGLYVGHGAQQRRRPCHHRFAAEHSHGNEAVRLQP